ncbi:MAG: hypothetical protein CSA32_02750 [Desulfobulbus propionicus]|nr:MAG: hypothetical protein CSA32_02750 [Desulfobulbus propionicus]
MNDAENRQEIHIRTADLERFIVNATCEVFAAMVFLDIEPGALQVGQNVTIDAALSSMIGLTGDIRGMVSVHCSDTAAKGITGSMLGMEVESLGEDVKDAIGEIANMVAGGLKDYFAAQNLAIQLAIPTTVIGQSLRISGLPGGTRVMVPFSLADSTFGVELKYIIS